MSAGVPSPVPWERFTSDPRRSETAPLRASDRDRDVVLGVLADGYAEGRLTRQEYDERAERTASAKTLGDLPALIDDLVPASSVATPEDLHRRAVEHWRSERRQALLGLLLGPSLVCWVIWLWTSFGTGGFEPYFPWPLFVSLGGLARVGQLQANKHEEIARQQAKLERRAAADGEEQ